MPQPAFSMNIQSTLAVPSGAPELDALYNKGKVLMRQKKYDKAADIFRNILHKKNDHFAAIEQLGLIAQEMGDYERALKFFKALTEYVPLYPQGWGYTGANLMHLERYGEAIQYLQKALALGEPAFAHSGLGTSYMYMGQEDLAKEHMKRAVDLAYDCPETLYNYFFFYYTFKTPQDPHLEHILHLVEKEKKDMPPLHRAALYTVLFKAYEDLKDYDKAMECGAKAGKIRKEDKGYNPHVAQLLVNSIKQYFDESFFRDTATSGLDSKLPVFILGMPRSGTTLLEQILHSHAAVTGIGEDKHFGELMEEKSFLPPRNGVPYIYRKKPISSGIMTFREMGENHLAYLESKSRGAQRAVDKGIIHYNWVGPLYLAFPHAYFIHLTRNPLSSALSAYIRNFANNAHTYTNDLADLGTAYRLHYEIMDHWKKVVPAKILDLSYESLVEDTENQARRVIDFLELPWDDNCLEFHKTKKVVKTASVQQVRKPIYKDSLQTWKKYEKHLAPLVEGLGPCAPPESLYILEKYGKK